MANVAGIVFLLHIQFYKYWQKKKRIHDLFSNQCLWWQIVHWYYL